MVKDINEKRAEKRGDVTIGQIIDFLQEEYSKGDIEEIVVVRKLKNGDVVSGWNTAETTRVLGLIEYFKISVMDELRE